MNETKHHWSVIETDNFGGDYPNESFVIRHLRKDAAEQVADIINGELCVGDYASRFWKVEYDSYGKPYELQPGFEP